MDSPFRVDDIDAERMPRYEQQPAGLSSGSANVTSMPQTIRASRRREKESSRATRTSSGRLTRRPSSGSMAIVLVGGSRE